MPSALKAAATGELFAFITQLRRLMEAGEAPEVKISSGAGGVQLMSIHKSKGLEFPIVISLWIWIMPFPGRTLTPRCWCILRWALAPGAST